MTKPTLADVLVWCVILGTQLGALACVLYLVP